jgi:hypothetical protein
MLWASAWNFGFRRTMRICRGSALGIRPWWSCRVWAGRLHPFNRGMAVLPVLAGWPVENLEIYPPRPDVLRALIDLRFVTAQLL